MNLDGRHFAGDLTGRRSAHPIGHQVERATLADLLDVALRPAQRFPSVEVGDQEGVFVVVAGPPAVSQPEKGRANGRHVGKGMTGRRKCPQPAISLVLDIGTVPEPVD